MQLEQLQKESAQAHLVTASTDKFNFLELFICRSFHLILDSISNVKTKPEKRRIKRLRLLFHINPLFISFSTLK